jgi:hypothetical protein
VSVAKGGRVLIRSRLKYGAFLVTIAAAVAAGLSQAWLVATLLLGGALALTLMPRLTHAFGFANADVDATTLLRFEQSLHPANAAFAELINASGFYCSWCVLLRARDSTTGKMLRHLAFRDEIDPVVWRRLIIGLRHGNTDQPTKTS